MADQIVLELEQVRRVDLDDILEGLVGCRSDALVRTLCIQFSVGFEEFFSWRGRTSSPKCLEDFPRHHNHRQTEVRRRTLILYHGNCGVEELRNQLSEIASIGVQEANQARQTCNHAARFSLTCQLEDKIDYRCLYLDKFFL